jgi:hypothetical protein
MWLESLEKFECFMFFIFLIFWSQYYRVAKTAVDANVNPLTNMCGEECSFCKAKCSFFLKVPKHETFVTGLFTLSLPSGYVT